MLRHTTHIHTPYVENVIQTNNSMQTHFDKKSSMQIKG